MIKIRIYKNIKKYFVHLVESIFYWVGFIEWLERWWDYFYAGMMTRWTHISRYMLAEVDALWCLAGLYWSPCA